MRFLFIMTIISFAVGCSHYNHHTEGSQDSLSKIQTDVELAEGYKAQQYADIYFSDQPPIDKFSTLKSQGFATVINLRESEEKNYRESEERSAAKKAGLNYVSIPIAEKAPLTDELIQKITEAVLKFRPDGKTLVHCGTGSRTALWAGGHFYKDHGVSKKEAVKIAEKLGINAEASQKLDNYLKTKD